MNVSDQKSPEFNTTYNLMHVVRETGRGDRSRMEIGPTEDSHGPFPVPVDAYASTGGGSWSSTAVDLARKRMFIISTTRANAIA